MKFIPEFHLYFLKSKLNKKQNHILLIMPNRIRKVSLMFYEKNYPKNTTNL